MMNLTDDYHPAISYPRSANIFASTCAILFIIVGIIGNSITTVALLLYPKLRSQPTTTFVLSLCVSDLLFCSFNLPLTAARFLHERWTFGDALCQLFPVIFYGNVGVSLLSMVAITLNRYVIIAYYDLYARLYSVFSICLQLLFIWGFSFGLLMPPLLGIWGRLGLDERTFSCTILMKHGRSPKKFLFAVGIAVPCIVIILSYSCIYWKVRSTKRKLENRDSRSKQSKEQSSNAREREDSRLTLLMLSIFVCFVACFLPLLIMNVADDDIKYPSMNVIASVLAWFSSVINPFIYAATNRQYRSAYNHLIGLCYKATTVRRSTWGSRTMAPSSNSARTDKK